MATLTASGTIQADMEVTRYRELPEDGAVQIWGYVGDYEASVWLPINDQRVRCLLRGRRDRVEATGELRST